MIAYTADSTARHLNADTSSLVRKKKKDAITERDRGKGDLDLALALALVNEEALTLPLNYLSEQYLFFVLALRIEIR